MPWEKISSTLAQIRNDDLPNRVYKVSVRDLIELKGNDIDHTHFKRVAQKLLARILSVPVDQGKFFEGQSSQLVRSSACMGNPFDS